MAGLLRFQTCGSVDDGKSTLIGRLLHDCRAVYEDQLENARSNSRHEVELAFLTDGLRAEREQGITIDVAYRYFSTPRRRFRIADTPGHEQYTRNMATGTSTADLAILLVDARKGLLVQTRRHACLVYLLGIRQLVLAVNKMDLVGYGEEAFSAIRDRFAALAGRLPGASIDYIPVSALEGDNVVHRSGRMPWHQGPTLLEFLEAASVETENRAGPLRMPVQYVIRSADGTRAYAGRVASGRVRAGDTLLALPAARRVQVAAIPAIGGDLSEAIAPLSAAVRLKDQIDLGRGDMLADPERPPAVSRRLEARLVWMSEEPLAVNSPYLLKHTTQHVCAEVVRLCSATDVHTLEERAAERLALNEIGTVELETHRPLFFDRYDENRTTGSFILIDPFSNHTVAAGMVSRALEEAPSQSAAANGSSQQGFVVWFTGLSSAGKSTLCRAVYERLWARGLKVEMLDGDAIRDSLNRGLGFSKEDRDENIRRIAFVAQLLSRNGVIVLVSAISPYRDVRDEARRKIGAFVEVYVNAPLEVCQKRDIKGLYRKVRDGAVSHVTGVDDPYEPPLDPEVECRTDRETLAESAEKVLECLGKGFIRS